MRTPTVNLLKWLTVCPFWVGHILKWLFGFISSQGESGICAICFCAASILVGSGWQAGKLLSDVKTSNFPSIPMRHSSCENFTASDHSHQESDVNEDDASLPDEEQGGRDSVGLGSAELWFRSSHCSTEDQ